jgi:hypothetical protein
MSSVRQWVYGLCEPMFRHVMNHTGFAGGLVALSHAATVAPGGVVALLGAAWLDVVVLTRVDAVF